MVSLTKGGREYDRCAKDRGSDRNREGASVCSDE